MATATVRRFDPIPPLAHRCDPRDGDAASLPWWLAYCRVHQEVSLARRLLAADVPHLLPLARHDRTSTSGNRRITERALFDGYLFISGERGLADVPPSDLKGLVSAHPVPDVPGLIRDLSQLMTAIESGARIGKARPAPERGDRARVISGPLEGFEGTYVREAGKGLLLLHVQMIGRAVPTELAEWEVEFLPR